MPEDNEPTSKVSGWATYEPNQDSTPDRGPAAESMVQPPYGAHESPASWAALANPVSTPSKGRMLIVVSVLVAACGVGAALLFTQADVSGNAPASRDNSAQSGATDSVPQPPVEATAATRVLRPAGYADLLAAVKGSTGDTVVFRAVLYPSYASIDVPVDPTSQRQKNLYWNGQLRDVNNFGTSTYERVDLAGVDGGLFQRLIRRAEAKVDDPNTTYVIIEGPSPFSENDARILAYASNEFNEGAYVSADLSGEVIRVVTY